jgi:hypothetical protein
MKMKPHEKLLGRNPLSNTSYRNTGMVLNEQGVGHHSFGDVSYLDLDTVLSEQGSDWSNTCWVFCCSLSNNINLFVKSFEP